MSAMMLVDVISVFIRRTFAFNYPTYKLYVLVREDMQISSGQSLITLKLRPKWPKGSGTAACNNYALLFIIAAIAATKGGAPI